MAAACTREKSLCFKAVHLPAATLFCPRHLTVPITITPRPQTALARFRDWFVREYPSAISAQLHLIQEDLSAAFYLLQYHARLQNRGKICKKSASLEK